MDTLSEAKRSWLMGRVRGKDTKPEMIVRRIAHGLGYRYRLHSKDLPGRPDLVFPRSRKAIFVHGCFWHRHECKKATTPKSNTEFWQRKFARNIERDRIAVQELQSLDWNVMVVWECETVILDHLHKKLSAFLSEEHLSCVP
ncbi:MAG: DNA mismatch endonuclease Vsr [Pacificimonas sp.]